MRKLVGALSALSLMVVPVAASAGTRANDVVPAAAKIDRASPSVQKNAKKAVGSGLAIAAGFVIALGTILIIVSDEDDDGISDG